MKKLTHSNLSGSIFYGTVNEKKGIYTKKETVDEEDFLVALICFIRHREKNSELGATVEVLGRKFNLIALEIEGDKVNG